MWVCGPYLSSVFHDCATTFRCYGPCPRRICFYLFDTQSRLYVLCVRCRIPASYSAQFTRDTSFVWAALGYSMPVYIWCLRCRIPFLHSHVFEAGPSFLSYAFDAPSKLYMPCLWSSVEVLVDLSCWDCCSASSLSVLSASLSFLSFSALPHFCYRRFCPNQPKLDERACFLCFRFVHENFGRCAFIRRRAPILVTYWQVRPELAWAKWSRRTRILLLL
jgi:hypothetical protein